MTDRQMCMRLARAIWPDDREMFVQMSHIDRHYAWIDSDLSYMTDDVPEGRGATKAAAIADLMRKLTRLAEKREERLGAAIVAVAVAKEARMP